MSIEQKILEAHVAHVEARELRDSLIRKAVRNGCTRYSLAKYMQDRIGEDRALSQSAIRAIDAGKFLYVCAPPEGRPVKIGGTGNLSDRLLAHNQRNPLGIKDLKLAFATPKIEAAAAVETYAHWLLRDHKICGEWFDVSVEEACHAIEKALADTDVAHDRV